ncbi:MAG: 1-acyl-sn-glycerol-3-phosphate acyltransferase [Myxococcales bacterium]|nr:1-acyl-sn-glycerol-3-phosphate acyltransferase [Myxococcales bacterium]
MRTPFAYSLQVARTALGFAVFGVLAALLGLVAFPVARIRPRDPMDRELWMQRVVHHVARIFMGLIDKLEVVKSVGHGVERLREAGPQIVVANHPTLVDVLALLACMPQADLVVSVERRNNLFLRRLIQSCGYLCNDGGLAIVTECVDRIRAGRSLIVFPEGTRSPKRGLHRLHRGAAHIALRVPCDLLPVVIICDPPAFGKGQKWYDLPGRAVRMTLVVGDPIATESVLEEGVTLPVAARRLTSQLRELFEKGMDIVDAGVA